MRWKYVVLLGLWILSLPAVAAPLKNQVPDPYQNIEIFLHTVDVGEGFAEKYGHTQIRIRDRAERDSTFSWGLYNFDEGFLLKFLRGILDYRVGVFSTSNAERFYKYNKRTVWEDKLNLTSAQKKRLVQAIQYQMQPENQVYRYQYFFDNCSTRPRDIIDKAVDGAFEKAFHGKMSPLSFRQSVRIHQATTIMSGLFLEVIMNDRLDRQMSQWEEMYLPKSLRTYLLEMPQFDDLDQPIAGSQLLSPQGTLVESPTPIANYIDDYLVMWGILSVLVILTLWLGRSGSPRRGLVLTWFAGIAAFGFLSFVMSTYMTLSWMFSEHKDLYHSANLWLLWPTDFLYLAWGLKGMWTRRLPRISKVSRLVHDYAWLHLCGFVILIALKLCGVVAQDVWRVVATVGLCSVCVHVAVILLCRLGKKGTATFIHP